ncbi:MAG TPA: tetratricopeptide repeat protein, partial [Chitinophagaceae bacterium]|nr:tetratricopeptide repeat protein [Chitinophagaceae bacterium]
MRSLIVIILVHLSSYCKAQLYNDSSMKSSLLEASRLLYGKGKPKNEKRALELLEECAGKGSGRAMDEIGLIYKKGLGVKPNQETAAAWFTKATATGYTLAWYHLGALYKEDASMKPDFSKIYNYFSKGKSLGDEQCMYALAYMHYKGLGCSQDYILAANLFSQGAFAGRPNSMYFYALCLRNGYGVPQNEDSAKFWLLKAAKKGYGMAIRELSNSAGENSNTKAKILAGKLKDVFDPEGNYHNRYRKVEHNISKNQLSGEYSGYIIKYDWSGQFAIGTSKVVLNLVYTDGKYKGTWLENDTLSIPVKASLTPHALVFEKTAYRRKDYYSPKKAIAYEFDQARLQWMQN